LSDHSDRIELLIRGGEEEMSNAFVRTEFMDYVSICRAIFHEVAIEGTSVSKFSNFIRKKA
jgi:hypothetical protein